MHMLLANKLGALGAIVQARTIEALDNRSPSAAAVLSTLRFRPELTTTEAAAIVGISQPACVRLIDGLERQGFIKRGCQEGRTTPLSLTAAGQAEVERLHRARLSSLGDLLGGLSPDETARFEKTLDRVLAEATTSRAFAQTTCRLCQHDLCGAGHCPIGNKASEIERDGNAS